MKLNIEPFLTFSLQAILVSGSGPDDTPATLKLFERTKLTEAWQPASEPHEVVVGKNGWAWGKGVYRPTEERNYPKKKEGDMRAPIGVFTLGTAFGYAEKAPFKWPYIQATPQLKAVDDPSSKFYNEIIDETKVEKDWQSAEDMLREDGLYNWGLVIDHNTKRIEPGCGSCIYMHIWRGSGQGTEGCTAMPEEKMLQLLKWLKPGANPVLIQGPEEIIPELR